MNIFIKNRQQVPMDKEKESPVQEQLLQKMDLQSEKGIFRPNIMIINHSQQSKQSLSSTIDNRMSLQSKNQEPTANPFIIIKSQNQQISQNQLREKLMLMFKKDKQKNHEICDYFMNDLGLVEHCDNIKKLIQFIQRNQQDSLEKGNNNSSVKSDMINKKLLSYRGIYPANDQKDQQQTNFTLTKSSLISLTTPNLTVFPTKVNFIASIFSRDKLQILLQLNSTNHKIINFLNFLYISLRSFIYTNQKQWILMKDQIQRYLSKYQKNVEKIYQSDSQEDNDINDGNNSNVGFYEMLMKKQLILAANGEKMKVQKTKQIKKLNPDLKKKYTQKFTLQNYKSQTSKVGKKLTQHQQSMCAALRKSCYSTYERFQHIVVQLKDQMIFVIGLLNKTEKFNQSKEKYLIMQLLLESRKVGVESLIYLQLIYKNIVERLEDTRRKIVFQIQHSLGNNIKKVTNSRNKNLKKLQNQTDYQPKCNKQLGFLKQVNRIFVSLQSTLMLNKRRQYYNQNINSVLNSYSKPQIVIEDQDESKSDSVQQVKIFQVQLQREKCQKQQQKKVMISMQNTNKQKIQINNNEESENEKFISAVIEDKLQLFIQKVSQEYKSQKETKNTIVDKKKKRIRKTPKVKEEKSQQITNVKNQNQIKHERVLNKQLKPKLINKNIQQPLPQIDSQDEQNQSSSLEFLSQALNFQNKQQILSPKKDKQQDINKSSVHYSSMKKSNPKNHYQEFQSLSIDIPLCLQYEQGSVNMEDIDKVSEQMSSFYNDVIENKSDFKKRE